MRPPRARVGVFGIGLAAYWPQFPGLKTRLEGYQREVESRRVPAYPGNIELLDASVSWLANQDSMISASPQSQQLPLIPPMTEAQLGGLRWALIGGLPVLILLIGAAWRLFRG